MRWAWGAAFVVAACSAETADLGPGLDDAGPTARDGSTDPRDAGSPDAGRPACQLGPGSGITVRVQPDNANAFGFATVVRASPLRLTVRGETFDVILEGPWDFTLLERRRVVFARIETVTPFWTESRVSIYDMGPAGGPGRLVFAAWAGASYGESAFDSPGLTYDYADAPCYVGNDCGEQEGRTLRVTAGDARGEAPPGGSARVGGYLVFNGNSTHFPAGPVCTDTPSEWHEGALVLNEPLPCVALARDACILTEGCVLWGSEWGDPGYACVPAQNGCEVMPDATSCQSNADCAWTDGECYCPEDQDCLCGGGPAPKCVLRCVSGEACPAQAPEESYCMLDTEPLTCLAPGSGVCQRVPPACTGAPTFAVCGCAEDGIQMFANRCEAHRARAFGIAGSDVVCF